MPPKSSAKKESANGKKSKKPKKTSKIKPTPTNFPLYIFKSSATPLPRIFFYLTAALHGVTLPIDDPFWEQFYPPNGWNCRCSVSQVRKSKYPATPHNEAMALGEVATQRDTRQMFRFNPGKEQKTFPNHNPYTISRCKNCDIAKNKLAK